MEVDLTAEDVEAAPPKRQKVAASKSPAASAKVKVEPKAEPKAKPKVEPKEEPKAEPKAKPKGKGKASGDRRKRGRKVIDEESDGEEDDETFEVGTATSTCVLRPKMHQPLSWEPSLSWHGASGSEASMLPAGGARLGQGTHDLK